MTIREKLESDKRLGFAVAGGLLLLAVAAIAYQVVGGQGAALAGGPQAFFSVDDGRTFFKDAADKVAPFDHGGKQAVRAYVFECEGERFVAYLEKYGDEARKALASAPKEGNEASRKAEATGRLVKRPGDAKWVPLIGAAGAQVTRVSPPAGKHGTAEPVQP